MKINFVLPFYSSRPIGGLKVVYEYASHLSARGHAVTVIHPRLTSTTKPPQKLYRRARVALDEIYLEIARPKRVSWQKTHQDVHMLHVPSLDTEYIPEAHAVFATAWQTAERVARYPASKGSKFYLVMDFEPWIAPRDVLEMTWRLPLKKITVSQWLCDKVLSVEKNPRNVVNIPIGIDHAIFKLTRDIEQRPKTIAMLYSLAPSKDSRSGLAAIQICKRLFPELEAVFFGASSRFRPKGIPKWIEYRGNVSERELVEIYNASRIYVCSSAAEGFALPPAEAMACGCAVAATDCGGIREFASDGLNMLMSEPHDSEGLAQNILRLLEDDLLRVSLARAGRQTINKFTWNSATDRLERFISSTGGTQFPPDETRLALIRQAKEVVS